MTPSLASCARWRDTVLRGCPVAAASVRTEGKHRPVRSAKATRFCNVQCRCRRTVRYRSRVTGTNESKAASGVAAQPARKRLDQGTPRLWQEWACVKSRVKGDSGWIVSRDSALTRGYADPAF